MSKLRKKIGIHRKGSSTSHYHFCYAMAGASGGFKIAGEVADGTAEDLFEELVGEIVPFVGAIKRAANLESSRAKFVDAAIERGTLLHCHWISSRLHDTLLRR
jgi:hypothetical protein